MKRGLLQIELLHPQAGAALILISLRKRIRIDGKHAHNHAAKGFTHILGAPCFRDERHNKCSQNDTEPEGEEDFEKQAAHALLFAGPLLDTWESIQVTGTTDRFDAFGATDHFAQLLTELADVDVYASVKQIQVPA